MKYIALDIGGVLCHANMNPFVKNISETFNVSLDTAARFLRSFQQIHDLGITTMERELRTQFNCQSEVILSNLIVKWNNMVYPSTYMLGMLNDLATNHDVKIALLSNIGVEHAEMMKEKLHPIYDKAVKHFSCFVGARKPSMLYYQSFLLANPEFHGCLYVDDLSVNLNASKQFGFKPLHFNLDNDSSTAQIDGIRKLMTEG